MAQHLAMALTKSTAIRVLILDAIGLRLSGVVQVSDKERKLHYDTLFKDIASVLVAKCVNADTNRPYTISMLERSLKDIHFAVDPKRPAKQQALEVLRSLSQQSPFCYIHKDVERSCVPAAPLVCCLQLFTQERSLIQWLLNAEHPCVSCQLSKQHKTACCLAGGPRAAEGDPHTAGADAAEAAGAAQCGARAGAAATQRGRRHREPVSDAGAGVLR